MRRGSWETGTDMYALLYIKQMTNKDLSYSTGKSTQNSAMTHMEKESKKKKKKNLKKSRCAYVYN